mmetsp:Transcript_2946/g.6902  ORF Transcript_2946/g.6902 Transcript_2946/m.6902 type:complete len:507 (-) Transcript_2946:967-2487(-)
MPPISDRPCEPHVERFLDECEHLRFALVPLPCRFQLRNRAVPNLTSPLGRKAVCCANLHETQPLPVAAVEAEVHADDVPLPRLEALQEAVDQLGLGLLLLAPLHLLLRRRQVRAREDALCIVVAAQRLQQLHLNLVVLVHQRGRLHADRVRRQPQVHGHGLGLHVHLCRQLLDARLFPSFGPEVGGGPGDLGDLVEDVHREPHGAALRADAAGDRLPDPPVPVRRELEALVRVEPLDRLVQTLDARVDEVLEVHAAESIVLLRDADHEADVVLLHQLAGGGPDLADQPDLRRGGEPHLGGDGLVRGLRRRGARGVVGVRSVPAELSGGGLHAPKGLDHLHERGLFLAAELRACGRGDEEGLDGVRHLRVRIGAAGLPLEPLHLPEGLGEALGDVGVVRRRLHLETACGRGLPGDDRAAPTVHTADANRCRGLLWPCGLLSLGCRLAASPSLRRAAAGAGALRRPAAGVMAGGRRPPAALQDLPRVFPEPDFATPGLGIPLPNTSVR